MEDIHLLPIVQLAEELNDPYLYARSVVSMLQRHDIIGSFVTGEKFVPTHAMKIIMADLCEINCVQPEAVWQTALRHQT